MSALDGKVGTEGTAELDGGGRTNLMTDGLMWQLFRVVDTSLIPITLSSPTGIVRDVDKYLVEITRPGPGGQYVLRWIVPNIGNIDEEFSTSDSIPGVAAFVPSLDDVGAILRTRTKNSMGVELGTFDADTRPTDDQALILIGQAYDDVTALVDDDIPEKAWRDARSAIALRAAMLIELSYWPDQIPSGQSPYEQLRELYEGQRGDGGVLARLRNAVARETLELTEGEAPETGGAVWGGFDDGSAMIGMETRW